MKLCACGCGEPAPIATKTNSAQGYVKGEPMTWVKGHHIRIRRPHPGYWTAERRERHAATKRTKAIGNTIVKRSGNVLYRMVMTVDGYEYEHRLVAGTMIGRPLRPDEHVHHIDGDGLNNDPTNLEVLSHAEHMARHRRR